MRTKCIINHRWELIHHSSLWSNPSIYTTKIISGSMYVHVHVCMYGSMHGYAFCHALRYRIKLKVGMGVGDGPTRFVGIFSRWPHLMSKVIQGSICLRNALWLPNLVRRIPDQSIVHCWGQRSCRVIGVNRGSNCLEMPYGHQIWWEESLIKA